MTEPKIYIIYENEDWMPPLRRELARAGLPYEEWFTRTGHIDLAGTPPQGVYLNRMSPSSHTRGHVESVALARELIAWLESHGRRVINGSRAFELEISKVKQHEALRRVGLRTPHTIAVAGGAEVLRAAARQISIPFITKHNRGGKGLGVRLFHSLDEFDAHVESDEFEPSVDGITLLQEYVASPEPYITRVEIVAGEFLYAIRSDTSRGFLLCPADGCQPTDAADDPQSLFSLREGFDDPIVDRYIAFVRANGIDIAGIEFIEDLDGNKLTYDVNTTTNYSPTVEERHGLNGMASVARLLQRELEAAVRCRSPRGGERVAITPRRCS